jgi:GNAT superfamily N-acetyltransferase
LTLPVALPPGEYTNYGHSVSVAQFRIDFMALPDGFTIRRASIADLETLVAHRRAMFQDMGYTDEASLDSMSAKFRVWVLERMNRGDYHAWLVTSPDGEVAAGAGLWLMDWPPHMIGHGERRGNILNVYTAENFRRRGLARHVMEAILLWCRENDIDVVILHASPAGKRMYEAMGFARTNEMWLQL